jgi:hypothetical protein
MMNAAKAKRIQQKFAPDQIVMDLKDRPETERAAIRAVGVQDVQFATDGLTMKPTKADEVRSVKAQLMGIDGQSPFGQFTAKDKDIHHLIKQAEMAEKANCQNWFAQEFDLMSPAEKAKARELYPAFYAERQKLLKRQVKNLHKLASIKQQGIISKEDLRIAYEAETGQLDLGPVLSIFNPEEHDKDRTKTQASFQRGIFNPLRLFAAPTTYNNRDVEATAYNARAQASSYEIGNTAGPARFGAGGPKEVSDWMKAAAGL